jgi:hypothetical protein
MAKQKQQQEKQGQGQGQQDQQAQARQEQPRQNGLVEQADQEQPEQEEQEEQQEEQEESQPKLSRRDAAIRALKEMQNGETTLTALVGRALSYTAFGGKEEDHNRMWNMLLEFIEPMEELGYCRTTTEVFVHWVHPNPNPKQ